MLRALSLVVSATSMALAVPAQAETIGFVSGWRLERGSGVNYTGCAISKTLPNGLTIGFLRSPAKGAPIRVVLVSKGWESLVSGQQYALAGQIGAKKFPVNAVASDTERGKTLTFEISWDQYYRGFFNMLNGFFFAYNGTELAAYSPSSYEREAVIRQSQCVQSYADPFAQR